MNKKTEKQTQSDNTNKIQYYTISELIELSKNNGEVDLKRLSPELISVVNLINNSEVKKADQSIESVQVVKEEQPAGEESVKSISLLQLESMLKEKYGESYSALEEAVRNAFENLAFKDARQLLLSRRNGDVEKIMLFYDNIYKDMSKPKSIQNDIRLVNYPPKTISGGNFNKADKKEVTWQDFI